MPPLLLILTLTAAVAEPLLNVSRVFWITIHEDKKPPLSLWPGLIPIRYLGLRGEISLMSNMTNRAKFNIVTQRSSSMDLPSLNAAALYLNHMNIWRQIEPGEIVAVFEEDAIAADIDMLQDLEDSKNTHMEKSFFHRDNYFLSLCVLYEQKYVCKNKHEKKYPEFNTLLEDISCSLCFGTSSYIVGYQVARELLKKSEIDVQIDSYISLCAMFTENTHLMFAKTKKNIFTQSSNIFERVWRGSEVQKVDFVDLKDPQFTPLGMFIVSLQFFVLGLICGYCIFKPTCLRNQKK